MGEKVDIMGEKLNFNKLLSQHNVIIPIIQRDYAQGRIDSDGLKFHRIRENLLRNIYSALCGDRNLVLDYIYGSTDKDNVFTPIDGQQRLTTLFLVYWYIAVKERRHESAATLLNKFSYRIRDAAKEFCTSLAESSIDFTLSDEMSISEKIKDTPWYHEVYNDDPTVCGMLVMLDAIHEYFGDSDLPMFDVLFDDESECITFWNLPLPEKSLPEDLFIKINARGRELTPFENFKAEIEGMLKEKGYIDLLKKWCLDIDNDWFQIFWQHSENQQIENVVQVENEMFRTILFYLDCRLCKENNKYIPRNFANVDVFDYDMHIQICADNEPVFNDLITLLQNVEFLFKCEPEILQKLFNSEAGTLILSDRAKLYSTMQYIIKIGENADKYVQFERICRNLIIGQRNCHKRRLQYQSALSQTNFGAFLGSLDMLVKSFEINENPLSALQNIDKECKFNYINYEVAKLKITNVAIDEIIKLEQNSKLCGMIHNFIEDNNLLLTEMEFSELLQVEPKLLLQAILSFSDKYLHLPYGSGERQGYIDLYIGKDKVTGEKIRAAYGTYLYGFNGSEFGELIWTAEEKSIYYEPVRKFIKAYSCEKQGLPREKIKEIIKKRIPICSDSVKLWIENAEIFFAAIICDNEFPYIFMIYNHERGDFRMCFGYRDLGKGHYNPFKCVKDGISVEKATIKGKDNYGS